ncbi:MAG: hypothetical protein IKK47_08105 [Ruminococcus sp.]|nr:hypothetical protein [Ruminococcus sp.]
MNTILKKMISVTSAVSVTSLLCLTAASGTVDKTSDWDESLVRSMNTPSLSMALPEFVHIHDGSGISVEPMAPRVDSDVISVYRGSHAMPSSFDLREASGMTSVKNQGAYGTCWAHSSASSAESGILSSNPTVDLSELHTAYFTYYGEDQVDPKSEKISDILNKGGNIYAVSNLWAQWIGPVYEEKMPYGDHSVFDVTEKLEKLKADSDYHLENVYMFNYNSDRSNFDDVNNTIKEFVYNGQGVDVSFYSEQSVTYNYSYNTSNSSRPPRFADHAVTICGWDDNFPASKFRNSPAGNGGWLVKNSWGSHFGEEGYLWISYYDKSLVDFAIFDLGDKENYDNIHQHDTFVYTNTMSAHIDASPTLPSYMANIFTSASGEEIGAISTYFTTVGTEYEVTVYSGLKDPSDPTSGTEKTVASGVSSFTGYETIDFDESVWVESGDFSVVVKLFCPDTPYVIPVETSLYAENKNNGTITDLSTFTSKERIEVNTGKNESLYSPDGVNWGDSGCEIYEYTDEEKEFLLEGLKAELFDGLEENDTKLLAEAQQIFDSYTKIFEVSDLKIISGNISMKAFGNNAASVEFSHISGEVSSDEAVTLSTPSGGEILVSINGSEYQPYTGSISVTEKMTISATTDKINFTERTYEPATAQFFDLCYMTEEGYRTDTKSAKRISKSEYIIELTGTDTNLCLYPLTDADITMNGEKIEKYEQTDNIEVNYGETEIIFELSKENALDNTVKLVVKKLPVEINLTNETLKYTGADYVYAADGTEIPDNSYIGHLAGQTVYASVGLENVEYVLPERNQIPDLELNYYFETLGFIPNETAELLEYSVKEKPSNGDYISAEGRLLDGTWINSGMVMNKAFAIIPGETVTLRVAAGNGKFKSSPAVFEIPSAPEAPTKIPEYTISGDECTISDFSYEIASPKAVELSSIEKLASKWGYSDIKQYEELMKKRMQATDTDTVIRYINAEWDISAECTDGNKLAVRYSATDSSFASKSVYIDPTAQEILMGDVDGDGIITGSDATLVLRHYTLISSGNEGNLAGKSLEVADYDRDGIITGSDATLILVLYTKISSGINVGE